MPFSEPAPANLPFFAFIRHGETDWNAEGRMQGNQDIPLNDKGRGQARGNGKKLKAHLDGLSVSPVDLDFVASPLGRARETMELLREGLGLPREGYRLDERLREITFGEWEGLTIPEIAERNPDLAEMRRADKWGFVPPGGESYEMLSARVQGWLAGLDRPSVIVAHGGVMRVLRGLLVPIPTAEIPRLDVPQDRVFLWRDGKDGWV
ncbi:histidine phosphatase family protein [Stappia sp. GBMRC 2046]|uniref:Histidine phosphatase family protein n=1 Tax=Stappia sediminis TaxID=2692190 RepID=A0A7X3S8R1_9HYPH|nr:histidine phosphatase family protein [Stappia sediminis]MXN66030.1 histidine phosphatase family protein [Stappia sediminis]